MADHSHGHAQPPLLHAAEQANTSEIDALLAMGHDIHETDDLGWTALHEAALNNTDGRMCQHLLERGANVAATNDFGETPLHMAAANETEGVLEICRILLHHGANPLALDSHQKTSLDIADERGGTRTNDVQASLMSVLRDSSPTGATPTP